MLNLKSCKCYTNCIIICCLQLKKNRQIILESIKNIFLNIKRQINATLSIVYCYNKKSNKKY